jgi:hypothetical protein
LRRNSPFAVGEEQPHPDVDARGYREVPLHLGLCVRVVALGGEDRARVVLGTVVSTEGTGFHAAAELPELR